MTINLLPGVPLIESPFFKLFFNAETHNTETLKIANSLHENGLAVIDFPDRNFDSYAEDIMESLRGMYDWSIWKEGKGRGPRLAHAYKYCESVRKIAANAYVIDLLSILYGRRAFPFQTLNFPVGTQQPFHSDSVHFTSAPERFMVGVWVAFEDITLENGPLEYYPGTHKWPIFTNEHLGKLRDKVEEKYDTYDTYINLWRALVENAGLEPSIVTLKKGQAVIWCANLLHGGSRQLNPYRSRHSQVTHYYFENCSYYVPVNSDIFLGKVYFHNVRDVVTGEKRLNYFTGERVPEPFISFTRPFEDS